MLLEVGLAPLMPAAGQTVVQVCPSSVLRSIPPGSPPTPVAARIQPLGATAMELTNAQYRAASVGVVEDKGSQELPPSVEDMIPSPPAVLKSPVPTSKVPSGSSARALVVRDPGKLLTAAQVLPPSLLCQSPPEAEAARM